MNASYQMPYSKDLPIIEVPQHLFGELEDPRVQRRRRHPLNEILSIALCSTIAGGDGWEDMENFGQAKEAWFKSWLKLEQGIPSDDTFRRVISAIDPKEFNKILLLYKDWVNKDISCAKKCNSNELKEQISVDGKCLRSAKDSDHKKGAFYMVNAWSTKMGSSAEASI